MFLMVEKSIRDSIINMQMLITYSRKIMIEIKDRHVINIGMSVIYMDGKCCKSFQ